MSIRLEMLQVARLAPQLLEQSTELVRQFLFSQQNPDGGFKDRAGKSDLYYTVFGLDGLLALASSSHPAAGLVTNSAELAVFHKAAEYAQSFGTGDRLDYVHLGCLGRCWAAIVAAAPKLKPHFDNVRPGIASRMEQFRSTDGGFHPTPGNSVGTAYAAFLGLSAYQDLQMPLPKPYDLVRSVKFLETEDGAWANERGIRSGATNATAAAVTLLRNLHVPINQDVATWLMSRLHPKGGFTAAPNAPIPDLLSTATVLHALAGMQVSLQPAVREACLDFIDTLWTNEGGFYGHWAEEDLDVEYTYYGLLALGHLTE